MEIYNKKPILVLWDIMKSLSKTIPIYKEVMHEEDEDIPESYILLRSQVADSPYAFGDGKTKIRNADCDIILTTKGYADDTTDLHNINVDKIRKLLIEQDITFNEINFGYDITNKNTQHTFATTIYYCYE